jgi:hypothetical protein
MAKIGVADIEVIHAVGLDREALGPGLQQPGSSGKPKTPLGYAEKMSRKITNRSAAPPRHRDGPSCHRSGREAKQTEWRSIIRRSARPARSMKKFCETRVSHEKS